MHNFNDKLKEICLAKNNRLCIGLDVDNTKLKDDSLSYMKNYIIEIIEHTIDLCPIYKINFSFYERYGSKGFAVLEDIVKIVDKRAITIADAKRGDIGNSSKYYAKAIFEHFNFDSVTVSPYMGSDSIKPFIDYADKGIFVLGLTSNQGSLDIQKKNIEDGMPVFEHVIKMAVDMNINNNVGLVIGATNDKYLEQIKRISSNLPWLMPGVGFQGGDLKKSITLGDRNGLAIINVSRGILNAGDGDILDIRNAAIDYTEKIRENL